jgi:UDP-3-O-[3-hydroxymyristoyl] glucosamine N-acyltransferase
VAVRERMGDGPSLSLEEVARLVGGTVVGSPSVRVSGVAPLDQATGEQLGLFADRRYSSDLRGTRGGAVLVSAALAGEVPAELPAVVVDDAHAALPPLLAHLHPESQPTSGVHATAVLGRQVTLGRDVEIGAYAVLGDDCRVGDRARIGAHVVVGRGSVIGEDVLLHPHVVLYPGTEVGSRAIVHAGARLGSDAYRKIPQVGRCVVEEDVEIGANTCIDRGSIGDTVVGRGSKLDNLVHLAHNVRLGPVCAMAAQVGIAGSTRVGKGVVFGGQAGLVGHLDIGDGAQISAQAGVIGDVAAGETVTGYPARKLKEFLKGAALALRLPEILGRVRALEERAGL